MGGYASAAYSRFGTDTTGYTNFITTTNDLLISGDLEVNATAQFDSFVRVSNGNSRAFSVTDSGGTKEDLFVIDATASASAAGLQITAGPAQTAGLFILRSSGGDTLAKFSDEGGLLINMASTSAFTVTREDNQASKSFVIDTLNSETRVSALSTKSIGFEVFGIASISHSLFVGPMNAQGGNAVASLSKHFNKNGVWINGTLCVDDSEDSTSDCGDSHRAQGTIYGVAGVTTHSDVAENFPTLDKNIEAGDVVGLDFQPIPIASGGLEFNTEFVKKASASGVVLGVITEKPGVLLGGWNKNLDPRSIQEVGVTLSGRTPVKVIMENGPIEPGDRLVASSIPGFAAKATKAGMTIGIALAPMNEDGSEFSYRASNSFGGTASASYGKVLAFVNLTYWAPSVEDVLGIAASESADFSGDPGAFGQYFHHEFIFRIVVDQFRKAFGVIFEDGIIKIAQIVADKLTAKELCLEDVCVNKNQLKALLEKNQVAPISNYSNSPNQSPNSDNQIIIDNESANTASSSSNEPIIEIEIPPAPDLLEACPLISNESETSPSSSSSSPTPVPLETPEPSLEPSPETVPEPATED